MPVRKHRAPKGALRLSVFRDVDAIEGQCQKAPSAKRCIKTQRRVSVHVVVRESESTERQKVH